MWALWVPRLKAPVFTVDATDRTLTALRLNGREPLASGALEDLCAPLNVEYLETMDCYACDALTGTIAPLASMSSLVTLSVVKCGRVRGHLKALRVAYALAVLDMTDSPGIQGTLDDLAHCRHLTKVVLDGCKRIGGTLEAVGGLRRLAELRLDDTQTFGALDPLERLSGLEVLSLRYCNLHGDISVLSRLGDLVSLDLSHVPIVTGDVRAFSGLNRVKRLNLFYARSLSGSLESLLSCSALEHLNVQRCDGFADVLAFVHARPRIEILFDRKRNPTKRPGAPPRPKDRDDDKEPALGEPERVPEETTRKAKRAHRARPRKPRTRPGPGPGAARGGCFGMYRCFPVHQVYIPGCLGLKNPPCPWVVFFLLNLKLGLPCRDASKCEISNS